MSCRVGMLYALLLLFFLLKLVVSRQVDELEDSVDALEKEYFGKLKVVQDLKSERDSLERKILDRKEQVKELARNRQQVVEEKKLKERSIESLKLQLQTGEESQVEELEKTLETLSHTLEETEIEYRNTLLHLEKLRSSVETDSEQRLLRLLVEWFSPCQPSLVPSISNLILVFRSLIKICGNISCMMVRLFSFFIQQKDWLNFLEALCTWWLMALFGILHIICVRWFLEYFVSDITNAIGSGILFLLVLFDWLAMGFSVRLSEELLSWKPLSWLVFFFLFVGFFNRLGKVSDCNRFTSRCSSLLHAMGYFALCFSFVYSCGCIPSDTFAKISWTILLLLDTKVGDVRTFAKLMHQMGTKLLRMLSSDRRYLPRYFRYYWDSALYKRRF